METSNAIKTEAPSVMVCTSDVLDFLTLVKPAIDTRLDKISLAYTPGLLQITYGSRLMQAVCYVPMIENSSYRKPISVPYKNFYALVKNAGSMSLELAWDNTTLTVISEVAKQTLSVDSENITSSFESSSNSLPFHSLAILEAFPSMLKIVKSDSPRSYGTVIYMQGDNGSFGFVGTDGFRLAKSEHRLADYSEFNGAQLSVVTCKILLAAAKSKQTMKLGVSEDKAELTLRIEARGTTIKFRLPVFTYPNYQQVLPKKQYYGQNFSVKLLSGVVKSALQTTDRSNAISLNTKAITTKNLGQSDSSYSLANCFANDRLETKCPININGKFLLDTLLTTKELTGQICINWEDENEPIKLILGNVETIIMPIMQDKK